MTQPAAGPAVLVAGGTGFIGSALCRRLLEAGRDVTVLTRTMRPVFGRLHYASWAPQDAQTAATVLAQTIGNYSTVINLAGESVLAGRWNDAARNQILQSRLDATRSIVRAIELSGRKPAVLINASAIGYYGTDDNRVFDETSPAGHDFLASVCNQWEQEAQRAQALGVRVVRLRIGLVLGRAGGALRRMLLPFKMGLGGPLGSGRQWMSWIHIDDLSSMILWLMEQPKLAGAFNAVAPQPVTNLDFSKTLAAALHRPCFLKTPAVVLKMALGEASALLLNGQNVRPQAAVNAGFQFQYPQLETALCQLIS